MSLVPKKVVLQIHLRSRALIINFLLLSTQVPPLDLICHEVQLSGDLAFTVYLAKARPVCYNLQIKARFVEWNSTLNSWRQTLVPGFYSFH